MLDYGSPPPLSLASGGGDPRLLQPTRPSTVSQSSRGLCTLHGSRIVSRSDRMTVLVGFSRLCFCLAWLQDAGAPMTPNALSPHPIPLPKERELRPRDG